MPPLSQVDHNHLSSLVAQPIHQKGTMTTSSSLKYWKRDNVYFVPPKEGALGQPALVFESLKGLQQAMNELENGMSEDDPFREALRAPSERADSRLKMEILQLILAATPEKECLIWLDRSREPRLEWMGDRPRKTLKEGFEKDWLPSLTLTPPIPDYVKALSIIFKNKLAEDEDSSSFATQITASAPVDNEQKSASVATTPTASDTATTEKQAIPTADVPSADDMVAESTPGETKEASAASGSAAEGPKTDKETSAGQDSVDKDATMVVEKATEEGNRTAETTMEVEESPEEKKTSPEVAMETEATTEDKTIVEVAQETMDIEEAPKKEVADEKMSTEAIYTAERNAQNDETEHSVANSTKSKKEKPAPARVSIEPTRTRRNRGKAPPPPEIAEHDKDAVFECVSETEAKQILKMAGFVLTKKMFELPGSEESFSTLEEMQHDLRRNGIPNFPGWSPEQRLQLEKWVRQSIYQTGKFPNSLPNQSEISSFKDLMRIAGFQWKTSCLYVYPHVELSQARQDDAFCFVDERGLMVSLARDGLPEYLYETEKPELTEGNLLAMEYYTDTFVYLPSEPKYRRNLFVREWIGPKKRGRHDSSDEHDTGSLSSTSSKKARTTPSKGRNTRSTPSKGKKSPPAKSNKVTPNKSNKRSPAKSRKAAVEEPSTPTTAITEATMEASVDALPWPPVMDPVEEIEGETDRERLVNAQAALSQTPDKPVFPEESSLCKNLKRVQDMIHQVVRSTGRHGGEISDGSISSSKALYVCGVPGTGKTLSISWICKHVLKLQEEGQIGVERDEDHENVDWRFLLQNANSVPNADAFRENMANKLGIKQKSSIAKTLKNKGLVLVVDEIDGMLRSSEMKKLLEKLLEYANDEDMRFALIGISNSLMDEKYTAVREAGNVSLLIGARHLSRATPQVCSPYSLFAFSSRKLLHFRPIPSRISRVFCISGLVPISWRTWP